MLITGDMLEEHRSGQKHTNRLMPQLPDLLCGLQLDFSIVGVSVVVLALDALLPSVQWLKGLRVLRALKPLRSQPFTNSACCTHLHKGFISQLTPAMQDLILANCNAPGSITGLHNGN